MKDIIEPSQALGRKLTRIGITTVFAHTHMFQPQKYCEDFIPMMIHSNILLPEPTGITLIPYRSTLPWATLA